MGKGMGHGREAGRQGEKERKGRRGERRARGMIETVEADGHTHTEIVKSWDGGGRQGAGREGEMGEE